MRSKKATRKCMSIFYADTGHKLLCFCGCNVFVATTKVRCAAQRQAATALCNVGCCTPCAACRLKYTDSAATLATIMIVANSVLLVLDGACFGGACACGHVVRELATWNKIPFVVAYQSKRALAAQKPEQIYKQQAHQRASCASHREKGGNE
jgi:hypothetical protein